jgi:hypothetical protein
LEDIIDAHLKQERDIADKQIDPFSRRPVRFSGWRK